MNKKIHPRKTNELAKIDFKEIIYSSFELLADDIANALIKLEMKYLDENLLLSSEFSDELAYKFDHILDKIINELISDLENLKEPLYLVSNSKLP